MKTIDTRGKLCPAPLILTKKGITEVAAGEELEILTDNETALGNLTGYLTELKIVPTFHKDGTVYTLRITKPIDMPDGVEAAAYCSPLATTYVVAVKADVMGQGDDALGRILLRAFINSLQETEQLPTAIILYNSGVKVAVKGTDTAASLQALEEKGVSIIACGTCVDYYGLQNQLAVGMISNMYKITTLLAAAGHIIYP